MAKLKLENSTLEVYAGGFESFLKNILIAMFLGLLGVAFLYGEYKDSSLNYFSLALLVGGPLVLMSGLHILHTFWKLLLGDLNVSLLRLDSSWLNYSKYSNMGVKQSIPSSNIESIIFVKKYTGKSMSGAYVGWGLMLVKLKKAQDDIDRSQLVNFEDKEYIGISIVPKGLMGEIYTAAKTLDLPDIKIELKEHITLPDLILND